MIKSIMIKSIMIKSIIKNMNKGVKLKILTKAVTHMKTAKYTTANLLTRSTNSTAHREAIKSIKIIQRNYRII